MDDKVEIEEMLRDIENIKGEATETKVGTIIPGEMPMIVSSLENTGLVLVFDTQTGESSKVPVTMLRQILRRRRPDRSMAFTTIKPNFAPSIGTLKCVLHPANPERERFNKLGFPVCQKSNLPSPFMANQHVKKRHPSVWATLEEERKQKEKEEEKEFQRSLLTGIKAPQFTCEECGASFGKRIALEGHKRSHKG